MDFKDYDTAAIGNMKKKVMEKLRKKNATKKSRKCVSQITIASPSDPSLKNQKLLDHSKKRCKTDKNQQ